MIGQIQFRSELPPLLEFTDGRSVDSKLEWPERRDEIRSLLIQYFVGSYPAITPKIILAEVISEKTFKDSSKHDQREKEGEKFLEKNSEKRSTISPEEKA